MRQSASLTTIVMFSSLFVLRKLSSLAIYLNRNCKKRSIAMYVLYIKEHKVLYHKKEEKFYVSVAIKTFFSSFHLHCYLSFLFFIFFFFLHIPYGTRNNVRKDLCEDMMMVCTYEMNRSDGGEIHITVSVAEVLSFFFFCLFKDYNIFFFFLAECTEISWSYKKFLKQICVSLTLLYCHFIHLDDYQGME